MKLGEHSYAFLHKSLLEYFAAKELFAGVVSKMSIALGYELNERLLTNQAKEEDEEEGADTSGTLEFLAEQVQQNEELKESLLELIKASRYEADSDSSS